MKGGSYFVRLENIEDKKAILNHMILLHNVNKILEHV